MRSKLDLDGFINWINTAPISELLKNIDQIYIYLLTIMEATTQNNKLQNYIFFCQQVKVYLMLKLAISTGDIRLLPHVIAHVAVMFYGCQKFNYQIKTLFMFWVISMDASSNELKKTILANSLVNIQKKKNKFIFLDLHLNLHNSYIKKVM